MAFSLLHLLKAVKLMWSIPPRVLLTGACSCIVTQLCLPQTSMKMRFLRHQPTPKASPGSRLTPWNNQGLSLRQPCQLPSTNRAMLLDRKGSAHLLSSHLCPSSCLNAPTKTSSCTQIALKKHFSDKKKDLRCKASEILYHHQQ